MARLKGKLVTRPDQVVAPDPRVRGRILIDQEGLAGRICPCCTGNVEYPAFIPFNDVDHMDKTEHAWFIEAERLMQDVESYY